MARSRTELLSVFRTTATEVAERDFNGVAEKTAIAELGIDSLGMLEIIGSLERELRIRIPDESLAGVVTIEDLLDAVHAAERNGAAPSAGAVHAAPVQAPSSTSS